MTELLCKHLFISHNWFEFFTIKSYLHFKLPSTGNWTFTTGHYLIQGRILIWIGHRGLCYLADLKLKFVSYTISLLKKSLKHVWCKFCPKMENFIWSWKTRLFGVTGSMANSGSFWSLIQKCRRSLTESKTDVSVLIETWLKFKMLIQTKPLIKIDNCHKL